MSVRHFGAFPLMLAGLAARRSQAIGSGGFYQDAEYMGAGGYGGGFDDDSDLDWDDDEIGAIEAEDDDYDDEIGAHGRGTARKIQRLKQKRTQLQQKLQTARRPRRRNRIQRRIQNLNSRISNLEAKLDRKVTRAVQKGRISPGEAAALGVAAGVATTGATMGVRRGPPQTQFADQAGPSGTTLGYGSEQRWGAFPGVASPMAYLNQVQRTPPAGNEIRIPLLVSGSPVAGVSVAAGAGPTTIAVAAQSRVIPYAGFEVIGLDIDFNQLPNAESLPNILVSTYQVDGEKNLLYDVQGASFAGQATGLGQQSTRRTISGLRENQIMQPNNTISANLTFRQDAANATTPVVGTIQIAAVVRTIWDPAVQR